MIIDSSALIAVLLNEDDDFRMLAAISGASRRKMAAPTLVETSLVFAGRVTSGSFGRLDDLISGSRIQIIPFDEQLAYVARDAHCRFGKGRHSASLNFGDCMAYALAKLTGEPLLFKGNDFSKTDITPALT